MTVVYSNDFDAETVGILPAGWANKIGSWSVSASNAVSGNGLRGTTANDVAIYTGVSAIADQELLYSFKTWNNGGSYPIPAPVLRSNSGYTTAYIIVFTLSGTTITEAKLYKRIASANTLVLLRAISVAFTAGDVIGIRAKVVGSAVSLTIWNSTVGSEPGSPNATWTDTAVSAAGYGGFYCAGAAGATADVLSISDLAATGDATASGATLTGTSSLSPGTATGQGDAAATGAMLTGTSSLSAGSASAVNFDTSLVLFSPYTWNVQANSAKAVNAGAYFKAKFSGASCTLVFNVTGLTGNLPKIAYRIDGMPFVRGVTIAATVALTMPTETTAYASHLLEVIVETTNESASRWDGASNVVYLTGITLASGGTLTKPDVLPLKGIFYGDSITEGVNVIGDTGDVTIRSTALQAWSLEAGRILGAEVGNIGWASQGVLDPAAGSVPNMGSTWGYIYSGVARSFSPEPDFIVINQGTNDGTTNITTAYTAILNGLLATTALTEIFVMRPFGGSTQAANIQAAIAACSDTSRVHYVDTAGWYNTANSYDTTHPNGFENLSNLAPRIANVIRPVIQPLRGARTARSVSINLVDGSGSARPSLTGLKWAFFDQLTPDLMTVAADQGTGETTDGSGVLTITVHTTLSAGQVGWLIVTDSDGTTMQSPSHKAFSGPVTVA